MDFTITITGKDSELTPAVKALVSALAQGNAGTTTTTDQPASQPSTPSNKSKNNRNKPAGPEQGKDTDPETVEGDTDSGDQAEIPSVVELRAKAQEVGKTPEQKAKIKALLVEFESNSISDLPEDKRTEFMKRLERL